MSCERALRRNAAFVRHVPRRFDGGGKAAGTSFDVAGLCVVPFHVRLEPNALQSSREFGLMRRMSQRIGGARKADIAYRDAGALRKLSQEHGDICERYVQPYRHHVELRELPQRYDGGW